MNQNRQATDPRSRAKARLCTGCGARPGEPCHVPEDTTKILELYHIERVYGSEYDE